MGYKVIVLLNCHAEEGGKEFHVFLNCKVGIEREFTRHITHTRSHFVIFGSHIKTIDFSVSFVGVEQCDKYFKQGGLPGTIGTYQAEYLATLNLERHMVKSLDCAIALADAINLYCQCAGVHTECGYLSFTLPDKPSFR